MFSFNMYWAPSLCQALRQKGQVAVLVIRPPDLIRDKCSKKWCFMIMCATASLCWVLWPHREGLHPVAIAQNWNSKRESGRNSQSWKNSRYKSREADGSRTFQGLTMIQIDKISGPMRVEWRDHKKCPVVPRSPGFIPRTCKSLW